MRQSSTFVTADTTLVTTAETVIATITGITTSSAGQTVGFTADCTVLTGASTTGVTLRVRRDSLAGALVGEAINDALEAAAGSVESHHGYVEEVNPGEFSGRTYVLTAQQVAATANGTVQQASLVATVTP